LAGKKRKTFATTIDSEISQDFNEVLEKLMVMYIQGEIIIKNE
jgi:hypothetical protein